MTDQTRACKPALASAVIILLLAVPAAYPMSGSFVMNTAPASGNTVQLGSFNASLSEIGPATENSTVDETNADELQDTLVDYNHENQTVDPVNNTIRIENPTTSDTNHVNITVTYSQNDSGVNDIIDDSVATASSLNVTVLEYNGTDLLAQRVTDANGNGAKDLDDVQAANLSRLAGITGNSNATLTISISGDSTNNDNVGGGDGVDFTISIELATEPSWRDTDRSTGNTIQYGT